MSRHILSTMRSERDAMQGMKPDVAKALFSNVIYIRNSGINRKCPHSAWCQYHLDINDTIPPHLRDDESPHTVRSCTWKSPSLLAVDVGTEYRREIIRALSFLYAVTNNSEVTVSFNSTLSRLVGEPFNNTISRSADIPVLTVASLRDAYSDSLRLVTENSREPTAKVSLKRASSDGCETTSKMRRNNEFYRSALTASSSMAPAGKETSEAKSKDTPLNRILEQFQAGHIKEDIAVHVVSEINGQSHEFVRGILHCFEQSILDVDGTSKILLR